VPVDRIVIPANDDLPPLKDMVETALANRSDLAAEQAGVETAQVSALGTKNGVRPTLVGFASTSQAGLAGTARPVSLLGFTETPNPYFVGGLGTALGQVFRRNFPSEGVGAFYSAQLRNRQAEADQGIDQLQLRQNELAAQKDRNQLQVDILNSIVALRQARARYEAAVQNRILAQQLFEAEQKKFLLGSSTPYNVVQQERDLATAQSTEIAALVSYSNARLALDRTLGTTLDTNHISIAEARQGKVARSSALPAVLSQQP
jgi:outer membrane protein